MLLDRISHSIKNPLASLILSIQMLKRVPEKRIELFPEFIANAESSLLSIERVIDGPVKTRSKQDSYTAAEYNTFDGARKM